MGLTSEDICEKLTEHVSAPWMPLLTKDLLKAQIHSGILETGVPSSLPVES